MFEQNARQAGEDLHRDFFHWDRPRVPQANHPHSFLAPVRTVLRTETPDVYLDLLARGAREYHDFDWFGEHPRPDRRGPHRLPHLDGPALRPWFDAQVTADRGNEQRLNESSPSSDQRAAALAACAFDDPVVMRARAQVRHLLQPADDAYSTDEVDRAVTDWLAAHPDFSPTHDGPTRDQWNALTKGGVRGR